MTPIPPVLAEWLLSCSPDSSGMCRIHGEVVEPVECPTSEVLRAVREERKRQVERYGSNAHTTDGTGPGVEWLQPVAAYPATEVELLFRDDYEKHERKVTGQSVTWMRLVREEVAEAFKESDPQRLEEELIQVAALCVSWVEKLRARRG